MRLHRRQLLSKKRFPSRRAGPRISSGTPGRFICSGSSTRGVAARSCSVGMCTRLTIQPGASLTLAAPNSSGPSEAPATSSLARHRDLTENAVWTVFAPAVGRPSPSRSLLGRTGRALGNDKLCSLSPPPIPSHRDDADCLRADNSRGRPHSACLLAGLSRPIFSLLLAFVKRFINLRHRGEPAVSAARFCGCAMAHCHSVTSFSVLTLLQPVP